jgi:uncharacterized protein YdeI (YjbR/CyaY-like superfamily)
MSDDFNGIKREKQSMPGFVEKALKERGLLDDYRSRSPYQQNDDLLWIHSAKRRQTKEKRLNQMIDELDKGGVYMKMDHPPSRK